MRRKTNQKRLESFGVAGIRGEVNEEAARSILQMKKSAKPKNLKPVWKTPIYVERGYYLPKKIIGEKFKKREGLRTRLEGWGVPNIIGDIDEEKARRIQSKKSASEKRILPSWLENFYKEQQEWLKKRGERQKKEREYRPIRKGIEKMQKERRKIGAIAKQEAKRIFAAKPYDPHKKERSKVKWK